MSLKLAILLVLLATPVYAQECTDLVMEIRSLHSEAFNEYHQLNDVKQDMLLILYGRERVTCPKDVSELSKLTKEFILKFDSAYKLHKSNNSQNHTAALNLSKELKVLGTGLSQFKLGVEADDLANSARQAVREFLLTQAKAYAIEAEKTQITEKKIFNYGQAGIAYENAGENLEATTTRLKQSALEKIYQNDMEKAWGLFSTAKTEYLEASKVRSKDFFSKVDAYISARSARIHFEEALIYYKYHYEIDKIKETEKNISAVSEMMQSLRIEIGRYLFSAGAALTSILLFLINRLEAWNKDTYDYYLGNELVQGARQIDAGEQK